jgi:hypothetical protein
MTRVPTYLKLGTERKPQPAAVPPEAAAPQPSPDPWAAMQAVTWAHADELLATDSSLVRANTPDGEVVAHRIVEAGSYPELVQKNLDLVMEAAQKAGINAAVLDTTGPGRYAVAVRADDHKSLLAALAEAWADQPVYLRPVLAGRLSDAIVAEAARRESPDELPTSTTPIKTLTPTKAARKKLKPAGVLAGAVQPEGWLDALEAPILQVYRYWVGEQGRTVIGTTAACEVEFWFEVPNTSEPEPEPDRVLVPTRSNRRVAELGSWTLDPAGRTIADRTYPTFAGTGLPLDVDVPFPIDLVYTWVDGSDPEHRARRAEYLPQADQAAMHGSATADARWRDRDELKYALRSVEAFAPWINRIWIVTEDQVPAWLDTSNPRVSLVSSRDIFVDKQLLPTFNSHAVEAQLHHIDGLAEHYLYSNDDYFFGRPVRPEQFFAGNGLARVFRSTSKIDLGPIRPEDRPIITAHKNHRAIFERDFGVTITYRLKHAVAAQRRSVMYEIEERYPEEFRRTVAARFRSRGDLSFASTFGPYYLMLTARGFASPLTYGYAESALSTLEANLTGWLAHRDRDALCINDAGLATEEVPPAEQHRLISEFLAEYLPWRSPYEVPPA